MQPDILMDIFLFQHHLHKLKSVCAMIYRIRANNKRSISSQTYELPNKMTYLIKQYSSSQFWEYFL